MGYARIHTPRAASSVLATPAADLRSDSYTEKLLKLVPSEIIPFYVAGYPLAAGLNHAAEWALAGIGTLLTIAVRVWGTSEAHSLRDRPTRVQWLPVIVATVAFLVWTYVLGGPWVAAGLHHPNLAGLLVLVLTTTAPFISLTHTLPVPKAGTLGQPPAR